MFTNSLLPYRNGYNGMSDNFWRLADKVLSIPLDLRPYDGFVDSNSIREFRTETERCTTITLEVPGFSREDIKLSKSGNRLYVSGKLNNRKDLSCTEFSRVYTIVETCAVEAKLENGVLEITVRNPEKPPTESTDIPIR